MFKKKRPTTLTVCVMPWSPLEIIYLDLKQHQKSVTDKSTWTVHSHKESSPSFGELFDELSGSSDTESDVVSQKAVYFPFTGTTREKHNSKNTAVGLTCPLIPTYVMLDTSDSDVFMAECSEGLVLPLE